jgi:hypothetical protein
MSARASAGGLILLAFGLVACTSSLPAPRASAITDAETLPPVAPSGGASVRAIRAAPSAVAPSQIAVAPPQPTHPTYTFIKETPSADGTESVIEYRATWEEPTGLATEFRIYELTACLRVASRATDGKPCVSKGMAIPKDALRLITTLPGDARSARITWPGSGDGLPGPGPGPGGVLIRASNEHGSSIFTILYSDTVCSSCIY